MMNGSLPLPLSGKLKGCFAYLTIKDRLPVILTSVIDLLCRQKTEISTKYGGDSLEDVKTILSHLSQLKNEMQTNKPLKLLEPPTYCDQHDDTDIWNKEFLEMTDDDGPPRWFTSTWLYVECYMYKRIDHIFKNSGVLKDFDPFFTQKKDALFNSMNAIEDLIKHVQSKLNQENNEASMNTFSNLIEISVWGNQCDLSLSLENHQKSDVVSTLDSLRQNFLVNETHSIWTLLNKQDFNSHLAIILDNCGFELITDLCLLQYMTETCLIKTVDIYVKTRPWFVSDTTKQDFFYVLDQLKKNINCSDAVKKWEQFITEGKWKIIEHRFWTTNHSFYKMKEIEPQLYSDLSNTGAVIFKGDLNYRKLVADLDWPTSTLFSKALMGFKPSTCIALRTVKGGPAVGLEDSVMNGVCNNVPNWYHSGVYGMIQVNK